MTGRVLCGGWLLAFVGLVAFSTTAVAAVEDLEIGGRFLQDWVAWGDVDDSLGVASDDGTEVRSAYISAKGKLGEHLRFKADYDVAGGEVGVKDVYLELFGIPGVGNARVGHWTVPVGLDLIVSTKNLSFLEPGLCTALAPGRNSGVMLWNTYAGGRLTAEIGAFRDVDDFAEGPASGGGGSVAGRLTCLAVRAEDGTKLLHVAASVMGWRPPNGTQRFRARPELHLSDYFVDTGSIPVESGTVAGLEVAGVYGPWHFQGEYIRAGVWVPDNEAGVREGDAAFSGYSVQAGWFLTGESRGYKGNAFDRTKVKSDFLDEGGLGAWEIVARYSSLDLNNKEAGITGRALADVTVGLNWYLSSYARIMIDAVSATVSDADGNEVGTASALAGRVQFDF